MPIIAKMKMPAKINNAQAQAVNKTIVHAHPKAHLTITIKILHKKHISL